jgi:hypothetical protein
VLQWCLVSALAKYDPPLLLSDCSLDRISLAISEMAVKLVVQFLMRIETVVAGHHKVLFIFC